MGYVNRKIKPQTDKSQVGVLVIVFPFVVIAVIAVALCLSLRTDTSTQQEVPVAHDADAETPEDDTLHITQFLGYEFGKVYSSYSDILDEPWFGFLMADHDSDEPLSSLRFVKDSYEMTAKNDVAELASAFEKKYGIKMSIISDGLVAFYHGKYTSISIDFYRNKKKDDIRGTVTLEITDKKLSAEKLQRLNRSIKQQQNEDMKRM